MIRNEEAFYKICFDSLMEGLCITKESGVVVMNNSAFEEIFGYDKGELIGQNIEKLIPEAFREDHVKLLQSYFDSPKLFPKGSGKQFKGLHKSGREIYIEIGLNFFEFNGERYAKALIAEVGGRVQKELRIRASNRKLEREVRKRTEQLSMAILELEHSNQLLQKEVQERVLAVDKARQAFKREKELNLMQTKFMSLASHEFKTPLSGILTSAGLIGKYNELDPNPRIKIHTDKIKNLVLQLNTILDDFLFLENSESGKYKYCMTRFRFCGLIEKIVKDAEDLLKPGQIIEITPCKEVLNVKQDKKVVDIIIRNVLYNAIKYSPKNSVIEIKLSAGEQVGVVIKDHGIGIPKEGMDHIFERFFRARNALHIQGTGIGLNIVKRHLDKLQGSIEIVSEEGLGTEVTLKLPLLERNVEKPLLLFE